MVEKKITKKKPAKKKLVSSSLVKVPDTSDQLAVLLKDVGQLGFLSDKAEAVIVPSVFPGFNRASRVGGAPLQCMILLHGPSKGGKTAFAMGLVLSFQRAGHLVFYVDAEGTLDRKWFQQSGIRPELLPYDIPDTYEIAEQKIDKMIRNFIEGRKKKKIDPSQGLLIVIDSITKLAPESELAKAKEIGKGYPLRALMNAIWLDKLTPVVAKHPILFLMIAHEKKAIDSKNPKFPEYKAKGGDALTFDSSMVVRVDSSAKLKKKMKGKDRSIVIGQLHRGRVTKNKLGIVAEQFMFVMSNGKGPAPIGFDLAAEVLEEAKLREGIKCHLVRKSGAIWEYPLFPDGVVKGDGNCARYLRQNPPVLASIVAHLNKTAIDAVIKVEDDD